MINSKKGFLIIYPILVSLSLVLTGCDERILLEDLSQRQSIEVVNFLADHGIEVYPDKVSGSRDRYRIQISSSNYFEAISLIEGNEIPKQDRLSADQLLAAGGIFPQSREIEQLRLERVYASQVEEIISSHSGVKDAKAIVRLNTKNVSPSEVSLHLIVSSSFKENREQLSESVARIVPGVSRDKITISWDLDSLSEINQVGRKTERFLWVAEVDSDDRRPLSLAFTLCLIIFCLGGGVIGYYLGVMRRGADRDNQAQIGLSLSDAREEP